MKRHQLKTAHAYRITEGDFIYFFIYNINHMCYKGFISLHVPTGNLHYENDYLDILERDDIEPLTNEEDIWLEGSRIDKRIRYPIPPLNYGFKFEIL